MTEISFDGFYPMDDNALEYFYNIFVENGGPQIKEEEKDQGHSQPKAFTQDKTGSCDPSCPPRPEGGLYPAQVSCDLTGNNGGMSRTTSASADNLPPLQTRNVLSVVDLGSKLDLQKINRTVWNTEYKPKTFPSLMMRIRKPRTTTNIYRSGKMVCTGATGIEKSHQAARRHARILQKAGFPVRFVNFKVINCVCTVKTFPLNLEGLALTDPQHFSLELELRQWLLYKKAGGISAIIHRCGTLTMMGCSTPDVYKDFLQEIYPVLKLFRRI